RPVRGAGGRACPLRPAGRPPAPTPEAPMSRRPAALLLLPLALGAAAAVQPPAASTARYKVEMLATSAVDLSSMGQGEQRNEFALTAFVSVTLTDSADGRVMHAVLDSSSVTPLPP